MQEKHCSNFPSKYTEASVTLTLVRKKKLHRDQPKMNIVVKRAFASLTKTTTTTTTTSPSSFSYSSSIRLLSSVASSPRTVVRATAAEVVDEDNDDAIKNESGAIPVSRISSSVVKLPVIPTLLQPRVVVYDGVCHLCHQGVKWVIRADKESKIKFCCVQSNAAEPYLRACGLDREDVLGRFLFVEGLNVYSQGSTAALRVLSYLPLPYSALSTLWVVPTPVRDAVYDYVAKKRYDWFGKSEDCLVMQEKELLERFIDRDEMMDQDRDL